MYFYSLSFFFCFSSVFFPHITKKKRMRVQKVSMRTVSRNPYIMVALTNPKEQDRVWICFLWLFC